MIPRDELAMAPRYAAIAAAAWIGGMFLWTTPFLLTGIKAAYNLDDIHSAWILTGILSSGGAALMFSGLFTSRATIGWMIGVGGGLEVVGLIALASGGQFAAAMGAGIVAGFGSGLLMSAVPRLAARLPLPERGFGFTGFTNTIIASAAFALIPILIREMGPRSILWMHLVMAVALVPLAFNGLRYPGHPTVMAVNTAGGRRASLQAIVVMFLGNIMYSVCMGSYWAYIEPAATNAGISPETSGSVVALATIISLGGPALAVWLGVKYGRLLPTVLANVAFGLSTACTLVAPELVTYFVAITIASAIITFVPAYTGGVMIRLDPTARASNITSALGFLLNGAGPVVGAMLIAHGGMTALAVAVALMGFASAALHVWPSDLVDRATGDGPRLRFSHKRRPPQPSPTSPTHESVR